MKNHTYTNFQFTILILLRLTIGWHFLYEGFVKLINPNWTSLAYLHDAKGLFAPFYHFLVSHNLTLQIVDYSNKIGLFLVGLSLIIGFMTKLGSIGGIVMLTFYYLSHIPYVGANYILTSPGSYLFIDKNIIEIFSLFIIIVFPTSNIVGIDRLLIKYKLLKKWI